MIFDLISSIFESDAAKDAAKTQTAAADKAIAETQRQFDLSRGDMSPWMNSGRNSLAALDKLLGTSSGAIEDFETFKRRFTQPVGRDWLPQELANLQSQYQAYTNAQNQQNALNPPKPGPLMQDFSLADFQADPGYQFRLGEGAKAIENSAAAKGMQLSGANLKALSRFGQDFASNEYNNAFNRDALEKNRKYNFLTGQSGTGQQTTNQIAALGQNASNSIADNYLQIGNAKAAGRVGSTNAWTNSLRNMSDRMMMMGMG